MTTMQIDRAVVEQALEALIIAWQQQPRWQITDSMHALRAALAQQAEPESCTWQQDGDSDSGVYGTSCGRYFDLNDGTPEDNKMHWCCYCGKRLVQLLTEEGDDE